MVKQSLFALTEEAVALDDLLDQLGGEVTDAEVEEQIDRLLDSFNERLSEKVDGYVYLMAEYDARAESLLAEAARLTALAQGYKRNRQRLLDRLRFFFQRTGRQKVTTDRFQIALVTNGGKLPLVVADDVDPAGLPEPYRKVKFEIDREAIRAVLASGVSLPFAHLGERGQSIRIK